MLAYDEDSLGIVCVVARIDLDTMRMNGCFQVVQAPATSPDLLRLFRETIHCHQRRSMASRASTKLIETFLSRRFEAGKGEADRVTVPRRVVQGVM